MNTSQRILKDSTIVTVLNIGSRGIGFLVPILLAALFGASSQADAYYLANTIPTFVVQIIVIALSTVFVPIFVEQIVNTPERFDETVSSTAVLLILFSLATMLVLAGAIPWLLPRFAGEMNAGTLRLTTQLTLALMPILLFSTLVGLASAVLNAHKKFIGPVLSPGIRGIIVIVVSLIGYRIWGIFAVVWGMLAGEFVALILLILLIKGTGFKPKLTYKLSPTLKKALKLSLPMVIGMAVLRINPMVDRIMAAPLGEGSIAVFDYADKIIIIPMTLFTAGFFVVLLSHWSEMAARNDLEELRESFLKMFVMVIFIMAPLSVFLFFMRVPVIEFLFERGAFDKSATINTAGVLGILALGLVPSIFGVMFGRIHLVFQRTTIMMILSILNATLNIGFNLLLIPRAGLSGIAYSTTLTYTIIAILLGISVTRSLKNIFTKSLVHDVLKIIIAIVGAGVILFAILSLAADLGNFLLLFLSLAGFILTYFLLVYLQKVPVAVSITKYMGKSLHFLNVTLGGRWNEFTK